mmetsp:Transcript_43429/g.70357  ORF Transcript_43429/g.70357 Transcript_43429/m.70357 type:complete len:176 (-) Transcript_43429:289-816(-)
MENVCLRWRTTLPVEVVSLIGMLVPLGCARFLLTCQGYAARWASLKEELKAADFEPALTYHLCRHTRRDMVKPENIVQRLGMAIAYGADADLIFGLLQTGQVEDVEESEDYESDCCEYPFQGPFGTPLFAACTRDYTSRMPRKSIWVPVHRDVLGRWRRRCLDGRNSIACGGEDR